MIERGEKKHGSSIPLKISKEETALKTPKAWHKKDERTLSYPTIIVLKCNGSEKF
jgi:hypothetical protein